MPRKAKVSTGDGPWVEPDPYVVGCAVKTLTNGTAVRAMKTAKEINPANAVNLRGLSSFVTAEAFEEISTPGAEAILTSKYWGKEGAVLGVAFMEKTDASLQNLILSHMNAWNDLGVNVQFKLASLSNAEIRISRGGGGYWSYLGTDVLHIPKGQQTMNLEGFVLKTPLSEYKRVVRHETGHTLGFVHEHMRRDIVDLLDEAKTLAYFERTQGWSEQEVREQVLSPIDEKTIMGTPTDVNSIMCYQLPGSITKNGQPIPGGLDIDKSDADFAVKLYPKVVTPVDPGTGGGNGGGKLGMFAIDLDGKKFTYPKGFTGTAV